MRTALPDKSVLTLLLLGAFLLINQASFGQIVFQESSAAAGLSSDLFNTEHAHGLGVIWIDYDNDDWPDILVTNGENRSVHLYRNEQDGTFSNKDALLPAMSSEEKTGAVFADYDNDGDLDVYITVNNSLGNPDGEANILLQNQWVENGGMESTPLFINVAASAGVDNLASPAFGSNPGYQSLTAAWFDYDRDSCIDLFVGNMVFFGGGEPENNNALYKNNCDGTFTNVTISSGINPETDTDWYRPTLTAFAGIMDPNDIWPDLYVTNVQETSPFHHDFQFRNNGDGTFTEMVSSMPGIGDDSGAGMGIDIADIDLDGDWDIYMTDLLDPGNEPVAEGNPFYTGNPDGTWNENSAPTAGITAGGSWGIKFADFDQDGFEDLLVGTGDPILYHNNGDGTFTNITPSSGIPSFSGSSRGLATADYDRDGDLDVVVVHDGDSETDGPLHLYENITSNSNNYLQVNLVATQSNRAAINTLVKATTGGVTRMRQVKGAVSAHSQDELVLEFGLGSATSVDELEVLWPSGEVTMLTGVGVNQLLTITEPDGSGNTDLFTDVSAEAGVAMTHDGALFPVVGDPRKGTGAAWFDYDMDGDLDLYTTLRTQANKLWSNNGDGTFTDMAAAAGVGNPTGDGSGVVVADYNNDGCKDLFLANGNEDVLYENNCDGTFSDVTVAAGLDITQQHRASSASWGDYDNDGFVDLYISNHTAVSGSTFPGVNGEDYIFHNNGDGTFTDVSDMLMGVDRQGRSFIGGFTDFDKDGDLDIFKVNDCPTSNTDPTEFFRNDGGTNGLTDWTFTEISSSIGADWCQQGMGLAMGDYDRDLDTDLFFTDNGNTSPTSANVRAGSVFLRNDGGTYSDQSDFNGTANEQLSWGANFFDYDLDGWLDLYMAAGGMLDDQTFMPSILWENDGDGTFSDVSANSGGLDTGERTRTSAFGDYDGDGDPDMFLVNYEGAMQLFRNNNSNGHNWVIIDLEGVTSNRDGIGAKVEVSTPDGVTQYHEVRSGSSLGAGDDIGAYFGLAMNGSISNVKITWPSGTVQTETGIGINQRVLITENSTGGSSTLTVSPTNVDFGQVEVGTTTAPVALTLTNNGTADVDVSNVSLTGADAAEFAHDFFGGMVVPAGGQETLNVTFSPTSASAPILMGEVLYRVNAGGALVADWDEDTETNPSSFVNGSDLSVVTTTDAITLDASVPADTPTEIFQSMRLDGVQAAPSIEWDFPVTAGEELVVRLFFAEIVQCRSGGRVFDIVIEGTEVMTDYEVFAEVGCDVGLMKEFTVTPTDSNLDVELNLGSTNRPSMISAIEVGTSDGSTGGGPKTAQVVIEHNGTNGSQTVDLSGEGVETGGNVAPTAAFTFAVSDLEATFTDASTDSDGFIDSWSWDFGDGNSSTAQSPVHTYAADGTYTISLTVTDDGGLTNATSQDVTVSSSGGSSTLTVSPTSVDFGQVEVGATSAPVELTLTNTGTASVNVSDVTLSGESAAEFGHNFSGGLVVPAGGQETLNVTFSPGSVSAPILAGEVLYRVNAGGALVADWEEDSETTPSTYVNAGDLSIVTTAAAITLDASVPADTPTEIFQSHRLDGVQAEPSIEWDFPVTAGEELTVRLFFAEIVQCRGGGRVFDVVIEGTEVMTDYEVFAEVGCQVGVMKEFTVTPTDSNLDVELNLGSTNRPSMISAIEVATTDGSTGGGPKTAQLTIQHDGTNEAQVVDLTGEGVAEGSNEAPTAAFTFAASNLEVTFTDASTDSDGTIASWSWDLGDGNTSTEQNPVHTYASAGTYTVELTVTDNGGATGVVTQDVTVSSESPAAAFTFVAADLEVTFTDASTDNGTIASWSWDLGDGNTSTDQNPVHTYAAAGTYTVALTVTDNDGLTDTASQDVTVSEAGGSGAFIESDGQVVIEAENFHNYIQRGSHDWVLTTEQADFSGAGAMKADPDNNTTIKKKDATSTSPEMIYDVDFTTTGSYIVWVRVFAPNAQGNTIHLGDQRMK